jgi:hypothetical protein
METFLLDAVLLEKPLQKWHTSKCFVVAFAVVAVPRGMTARDDDTISPLEKSLEHKGGIDAPCTHDTNHVHIEGLLHA